jgi:hypothetical protein
MYLERCNSVPRTDMHFVKCVQLFSVVVYLLCHGVVNTFPTYTISGYVVTKHITMIPAGYAFHIGKLRTIKPDMSF